MLFRYCQTKWMQLQICEYPNVSFLCICKFVFILEFWHLQMFFFLCIFGKCFIFTHHTFTHWLSICLDRWHWDHHGKVSRSICAALIGDDLLSGACSKTIILNMHSKHPRNVYAQHWNTPDELSLYHLSSFKPTVHSDAGFIKVISTNKGFHIMLHFPHVTLCTGGLDLQRRA